MRLLGFLLPPSLGSSEVWADNWSNIDGWLGGDVARIGPIQQLAK